jgi:hypothetical protein
MDTIVHAGRILGEKGRSHDPGEAETPEGLIALEGAGHELRGLRMGGVSWVNLKVVLGHGVRIGSAAVGEPRAHRKVAQAVDFWGGQHVWQFKKH